MIALLLAPQTGQAAPSDDSVPTWVPLTLAGSVVLAGSVYVYRRLFDQHPAPSPQDEAEHLIRYIASEEELVELRSLEDRKDIERFLNTFFDRREPVPGEHRFRAEYEKRFREANRDFRDGQEGWSTDRGRIAILYGRPASIRRLEVSGIDDPRLLWKDVEIWEYDAPTGSRPPPPLLRDPALFDRIFRAPPPAPGCRLFFFVRKADAVCPRLAYTTEEGESIDPTIYQVGVPLPSAIGSSDD